MSGTDQDLGAESPRVQRAHALKTYLDELEACVNDEDIHGALLIIAQMRKGIEPLLRITSDVQESASVS